MGVGGEWVKSGRSVCTAQRSAAPQLHGSSAAERLAAVQGCCLAAAVSSVGAAVGAGAHPEPVEVP